MKIDPTSNSPVFRSSNASTPANAAAPATGRASKTDVVDFSRGQTRMPDKSMTGLKAGLLHDIAAPADEERLAALKAEIKAGSYRPSMDQLVDAILHL